MQLTASDIVSLYRPTPCSLRLYLRTRGVPESEPSAFDQIIRTLGQVHEQNHLATLGAYEDISAVERDQRVFRTLEAIRNRVPVIYQPEFEYETKIDGSTLVVVGRPDFLILESDGYIIRDSKLSRKVNEDHHEEILLQLQLYGWLFEHAVGTPAKGLQVHTGTDEVVDLRYDGGAAALAKLAEVLAVKQMTTEPYEPVGWSKCMAGCGYADRCWSEADSHNDVSLVMDVDQGLARQLHSDGITTPQELVSGMEIQRLSSMKRRWGKRLKKVGRKADSILRNAEVLVSGKERILAPVSIPASDNYVMFDLEGIPPNLGDLEKVYLWGMQVFGKRPSEFTGVTSGFGADGDREGWYAFLDAASVILAEYGDIPWIHWHHYERTHIELYARRYGTSGVVDRILANLLDLLPITKKSIVLPLPSYSLKIVEDYVGFKRTQDEFGGSWAMAKFILATETDDEAERSGLIAEILKYNEEDLGATWAVFEWLRSK
jgi:predicted RecB family nuclease